MNASTRKDWSLKPNQIQLSQSRRLHECSIPIVGITGGLGSGKSTVTKWFKNLGFFTLSADDLIKSAYQAANISSYVKNHIPHVINDQNIINFAELRKWAFEKTERLNGLEKILYQELPSIFLNQIEIANPKPKVIIYEIPLLFEKNLQSKVDLILTVTVGTQTQIDRAQMRDGSSTEVLRKIIEGQANLQEKEKKSHVVINNHGSINELNVILTNMLGEYFVLNC